MPKSRLAQQFDQMYEGSARFVIADGDRFTQTCCDCGSAHDIELSVINDHYEIQVELAKNAVVTKAARLDGTNGVLMESGVYNALMSVLDTIAQGRRVSTAQAKRLRVQQKSFDRQIKIGVAI